MSLKHIYLNKSVDKKKFMIASPKSLFWKATQMVLLSTFSTSIIRVREHFFLQLFGWLV